MSKHLEVWFQLCTPHPPQLQKKMFDPNFKLNKLGNYRAGDMKQRRGQVEVIPGETQPRVDPKPPAHLPRSQYLEAQFLVLVVLLFVLGGPPSLPGYHRSPRPFGSHLPSEDSLSSLLQCLTLPHQHTQMEFIALSRTIHVTKLLALMFRGFPAPPLTAGT